MPETQHLLGLAKNGFNRALAPLVDRLAQRSAQFVGHLLPKCRFLGRYGSGLGKVGLPATRLVGVSGCHVRLDVRLLQKSHVSRTQISEVQSRRALKRLGANWICAKHWITSPDPAYTLKKWRDRLIDLANTHSEWVLGFQDEVWFSRFASPNLHAWTEDEPIRLVEKQAGIADRKPKALACYGMLQADRISRLGM